MKKEKTITKSPQKSSYIACGGHLHVLHEELTATNIYEYTVILAFGIVF